MNRKKALLLASGGLDSTTLAYWLVEKGYDVWSLFFDYGQHCVETEWATLQAVLPAEVRAPERIDLSDLFNGSKSRLVVEANLWSEEVTADDLYIPYRTLLFCTAGAARAQTLGINEVFSGFINSNHAKEVDCTFGFLNGIEELSRGVGVVELKFPFRSFSKAEVATLGIDLGVPLARTYSCQVYSDTPCGVCPNCVDRLAGLNTAGLGS